MIFGSTTGAATAATINAAMTIRIALQLVRNLYFLDSANPGEAAEIVHEKAGYRGGPWVHLPGFGGGTW